MCSKNGGLRDDWAPNPVHFTGFYWVLLDFSEFRESSRRLRGGGVRLWVQSPLSTGCTQRYPYKQGVSHHLSTCYHRTAQPKGFFFGDTCRPTKLHHIFFREIQILWSLYVRQLAPMLRRKVKDRKASRLKVRFLMLGLCVAAK